MRDDCEDLLHMYSKKNKTAEWEMQQKKIASRDAVALQLWKPANNLCFASACKHKSHVGIPNQIKIHEKKLLRIPRKCAALFKKRRENFFLYKKRNP